MREQGIHIDTIMYLPLKQLISKSPIAILKTLWSYMTSFITSVVTLSRNRPSELITTGSDIAIPVVLAAYILRIPITLYEVNAVPGKTIRFLTRYATAIKLCFAQTAQYFPKHVCIIEPYPLRFIINNNAHTQTTSTHGKTVLVLGGSQGSQFINKLIQQLFEAYPEIKNDVTLLHQYGNDTTTDWSTWYTDRAITATTYSYTNDLAPLYERADLIICRAGAGSLFETLAYRKPMICIPLETVQTDHQLDNARACAREYPKLCHVIRQQELATPEKLYALMQVLLSLPANRSACQEMDNSCPLV